MSKPEPSSRHPLIIFLLALSMVAGVAIEIADAPAPQSVQAQLPAWGVDLWGWALIVGSGIYLAGLYLQGRDRLITGVLFEQVGVATLGPAAIVYAAAVFATVGWSGAYPAGITLGFGVSCLYRWWTLQRGIKRAQAAA